MLSVGKYIFLYKEAGLLQRRRRRRIWERDVSASKLLCMPEKESEVVGIVCICIVSYSYVAITCSFKSSKEVLDLT